MPGVPAQRRSCTVPPFTRRSNDQLSPPVHSSSRRASSRVESVRRESAPKAPSIERTLDEELDPPLQPAPGCLCKESGASSSSEYIDPTQQPTDGLGDLERVLENTPRLDALDAPRGGASPPPIAGAERTAWAGPASA